MTATMPMTSPGSALVAWRSARWREGAWFALLGVSLGGANVIAATNGDMTATMPILVAEFVTPLLNAALLLFLWLPVDRSAPDGRHRNHALVLAVLVASAGAAFIVPRFLGVFGLPPGIEVMWEQGHQTPPVLLFLSTLLLNLFTNGLAVAVIELRGRQRRLDRAVQLALTEQAMLTREALASRLAAMQAQVEPQFLFDALVDIEQRYGESDSVAAEQLERLIAHLRVALPRLRDTGTSLEAEAELLASYLAVVGGGQAGRVDFRSELVAPTGRTPFHPMLLLPLVQRAVRQGGPPAFVRLTAAPDFGRVRIELTLAASGLCADDVELARVTERLHALYDGKAQLSCIAEAGSTRFVLVVPPPP